MEGKTFDELAKRLQLPTSRRAALAASFLALAGSGVEAADKAKRRKKRNRHEDGDGPGLEARKKCPRTKTRCGSKCVDTLNDERYCGSCTMACGPNQYCRGGACCLNEDTCGLLCCTSGETCVGTICCPNLRACGELCCREWQTCVAGACCDSARVKGGQCLPRQDRGLSIQFGESGFRPGLLRGPEGVAFGPDGTLWVADTANDRVQHFQSNGTLIGQPITGFNGPTSLIVDADGVLYVADSDNDRVVRIAGSEQRIFASLGSGLGSLRNPIGLAFDPDGSVWIADSGNHRVVQITSLGDGLRSIGGLGTSNGKFDSPEGVAIDSEGYIYVADTGNGRVQKFNPSGTFLKTWGRPGQDAGAMSNPTGITIGPWDFVYVSDSEMEYVQIFNQEGQFVSNSIDIGMPDGYWTPTSAATYGSGAVAVADTGHDHIYVFMPDMKVIWTDQECGWGGTRCPSGQHCGEGVCISP